MNDERKNQQCFDSSVELLLIYYNKNSDELRLSGIEVDEM